ncbi:MAG: radical SAM family heme chaperone HemW [bacterium]
MERWLSPCRVLLRSFGAPHRNGYPEAPPGQVTSFCYALYVHYPFCLKRCPYCGFATAVERVDLSLRYRAMLREELNRRIREKPWRQGKVGSLYFGGGTPSLMPPEFVAEIIASLQPLFIATDLLELTVNGGISPPSSPVLPEVTLEANPETADLSRWQEFRSAGVNRISIGAQSFRDEELRFLGRVHNAKGTARAVEIARKAGFTNVSLDLIYGIPGQTADHFRSTLAEAIGMEVDHLSAYSLTVEPSTPYARRIKAGSAPSPDSDHIADLYLLLCRVLREAGFEHYELTNFARPGFASRHNSAYWLHLPYLGVGAGAHSFTGSVRFWNRRSTLEHLRAVENGLKGDCDPAQERVALSPGEQIEESLYLRLRTAWGIPLDIASMYFEPQPLEALIGDGFLEVTPQGFLRLSEQHWLLLDELFLRLMPHPPQLHTPILVSKNGTPE